jgi:hypothetical protein
MNSGLIERQMAERSTASISILRFNPAHPEVQVIALLNTAHDSKGF